MRCCIQYLCQEHHDLDLSEEELCGNVLSGLYRFHDYSVSMWLELLERYLDLVNPTSPPSNVLDLIEGLLEERSNDAFVVDAASPPIQSRGLRLFEKDYPDIYQVLCSTAKFYKNNVQGQHDKRKGM